MIHQEREQVLRILRKPVDVQGKRRNRWQLCAEGAAPLHA